MQVCSELNREDEDEDEDEALGSEDNWHDEVGSFCSYERNNGMLELV